MRPPPRLAATLATMALLVSAAAGLARTPRAAAGPGTSHWVAAAAFDSMDLRLRRVEARLGLAPVAEDARGRAFRTRYAALRAREQAIAARMAERLRLVPSASPVPGGRITSAFSAGRFHPIKQRVIPHVGLDIGAPHGAPVQASADGYVLATADHPTYGLTVDLRHGDSGFITRYAHLSRIAVRPGQPVRRGDMIGRVGSTGLSTGPHTHYEVFHQGWRKDPVDFLPPDAAGEQALLGVD